MRRKRENLKHFILDADNNIIGMADIGKIVNRTTSVVTTWFLGKSFTSIVEFVEHQEYLNKRPHGVSRTMKIYSTCKGKLNAKQIARRTLNEKGKCISLPTVYSRIKNRGSMCPSIFFPAGLNQKDFGKMLVARGLMSDESNYRNTHKKEIELFVDVEFDRTLFCFRDHQECYHYSSCTDSVVFTGYQHKRFNKNGSCYKEKGYEAHLGKTDRTTPIPNPPTRYHGGY